MRTTIAVLFALFLTACAEPPVPVDAVPEVGNVYITKKKFLIHHINEAGDVKRWVILAPPGIGNRHVIAKFPLEPGSRIAVKRVQARQYRTRPDGANVIYEVLDVPYFEGLEMGLGYNRPPSQSRPVFYIDPEFLELEQTARPNPPDLP